MGPDATFSPYVGLEPYDEAYHDYFFGREGERRLIAANTRASRLTVLHGESGAGKTSVLRAGVARVLLGVRGTAVVIFGKWQSPSYLTDLKMECQKAVGGVKADFGAAKQDLPFDEFLIALSESALRSFVIIFDQFEEYLFYHPANSKEAFDAELARAINRQEVPASFLVAMRSDSLSRLDRFRARIPNLLANTLELRPLTQSAARDAIRKPLEVYNLRFPSEQGPVTIDDRVVDELVHELRIGKVQIGGGGGSGKVAAKGVEYVEAPFLQLVLVRLWEEEMQSKSRVLRFDTLRRLGGPQRIVKSHLDAVMDSLSPADRTIAARMFLFLVTPSGGKIALRSEDLAKYAERETGALELTLRKLTDARILCRVGQTDRYEILHDVLAPAVLDWRARYQARKRRNKRIGIAVLAVGITVAVVAAAYTMLFQRREAESRRLALEALNVEGSDPELAVILSMYSVQTRETQESLGALHRALQALQTREVYHSRRGVVGKTASSRDGRWLAWTGEDGTATLRDMQTGKETALAGHSGPVLALAFSHETDLFATAGQDGALVIRDPQRTEPLQRIMAHGEEINAVVFGSSGVLVTGSGDGTAKLWKAGAMSPVRTFSVGDPEVRSIALRPDGRQLATGDSAGTVFLWDTSSGKRSNGPPLDLGPISGLDYSPDGRRLAIAGSGNIANVVDLASGSVLELRGHQSALLGISFSPSGKEIGTVGADRTARIWDSSSGSGLTVLRGHTAAVTSLAFLGDDTRLATSSDDQTVRVWDNPPNTEMLTLSGHSGPVYKIAVDRRGTKWATAGADGSARIWDVQSGKVWKILRGHNGEVASVGFSPDGTEVVTGGHDKTVRVWHLQNDNAPLVLQGHQDAVVDVAFSPDGKSVASASWDGNVMLWNAATGKLISTLPCDNDHLSALVFRPDGTSLYTGGKDTQIRVWDTARGMLRKKLTGHHAAIFGLAISRDGRWLASSDADGVLKIWDASTGEMAATVPAGPDAVLSVGFSPTAEFLAAAGRDGTVSEWEWRVPSGRESLSFLGHQGAVYSVVYSPDGKRLASAGEDHTARVYALDRADLLELARRKTASRKLVAEECRKYLHVETCPPAP